MSDYVYIVEGRHDVARLKQLYPNMFVVSVNGSAIDDNMTLLTSLSETHTFILCLDPDHAGERIRRLLTKKFLRVKHIFVNQEEAKYKKKIGLEHMSDDDLKAALSHVVDLNQSVSNKQITTAFLYTCGLIGLPNSQARRLFVSKHFKIGSTNGKTLKNRLNQMNISQESVWEVLKNESSI